LKQILELAKSRGYEPGAFTLGESISLAAELGLAVSDVVIAEAMEKNGLTFTEVLNALETAFQHNLQALEIGLADGHSFLMGSVARELADNNFAKKLIEDEFINKVLVYTLAAQIGNHSVGLEPCAGTGDACPYTGLFKALMEDYDRERALRAAAVMLKVGTIFRVGKTSTGCNMEGFGAGAAATAAALAELRGGRPEEVGKAVVLALSPTIATPCTPRVMVAGLCATHIGGAVLVGNLAANLAVNTSIPVTVPVDVMIAMARAVHPVSAAHVVPVVNKYLQSFFKTNQDVERYVDEHVRKREQEAMRQTIDMAMKEAKGLSGKANSIVRPFGQAVVGGSSQAVGSPTNAARIAHYLAKGNIKKVRIELYPELFARRGINVPGILMGAVYGAHTGDSEMYREVMGKVLSQEIEVEILEVNEPQLQRITVETTEGIFMVDTLNRGGGRVVIRSAKPSREAALAAAQELGIVVVE
jgi:L-serine dehydratase